MASETAAALGCSVDSVLVASTGVIGVGLRMEKVVPGIRSAVGSLARGRGSEAARAIMTTDPFPKEHAVTVQTARGRFTVGGMAKGSGMIHPALATMLAVVTTNYPLGRREAIDFLRPAVESTFNRISVDGECSTNDAVVLLANGASGAEGDDEAFFEALHNVCASLARQIVEDGEGATTLLEIAISGAASDAEASAVARRIATSPLVKTAAFGRDPNWGRVLAAAGSAPHNGGFAQLDPERLTLALNGTEVFARGKPRGLRTPLDGPALTIELDLGLGSGSGRYLASDLTYDYVRINAEYST
jgi:glutamate N-acetyltransferase/amino-acid N-acetyltransferase